MELQLDKISQYFKLLAYTENENAMLLKGDSGLSWVTTFNSEW